MKWLTKISILFTVIHYAGITWFAFDIAVNEFFGGLIAILMGAISLLLGLFTVLYFVYLHCYHKAIARKDFRKADRYKTTLVGLGILTVTHWLAFWLYIIEESSRSHHWAFG